MQHDRGCVCQECTSTSATDTVLVGISIITGVVIAISTGSKWAVAAAFVALVAVVVHKLRSERKERSKGLG